MSWMLITVGIFITLWAISLLRILSSTSCLPSKKRFLSAGSSVVEKRGNVLLVVAHPDDESMFFAPTILYLLSKGHNLHILCLSTGNADAKGNLRKNELYRACAVLKVPLEQVRILDHPDIQDGFDKRWDHQLLAKIIGDEVRTRAIDLLITFDKYGVSGHCNHRDVHHGICNILLQENSKRNFEAWELVSTSILRKYTGPVDVWMSVVYMWFSQKPSYCLLNSHPQQVYLSMAEHASQWIWFRKLFVLFSSYTYMNTLQKI